MTRFIRRIVFGVAIGAWAMAALAAPALAINVHHSTGRATVAQAAWGSVDPETGLGAWGLVYAFEQDGHAGIGLFEQDAKPVTCEGGGEGIAGTFRMGDGPADAVDVAPSLSTAVASGTVMVVSGSFDSCTWSWQIDGEESVAISLDLYATGNHDVTIDRFTDSVPGEYRFTSANRIMSRAAAGAVTVGGAPVAYEAAVISVHSFSSHFVGY